MNTNYYNLLNEAATPTVDFSERTKSWFKAVLPSIAKWDGSMLATDAAVCLMFGCIELRRMLLSPDDVQALEMIIQHGCAAYNSTLSKSFTDQQMARIGRVI